jgi:hypothetical protein
MDPKGVCLGEKVIFGSWGEGFAWVGGEKHFGKAGARLNFGMQVRGNDEWSLGGGWVQPSLIIQSRLGK